MYHEPGPAALRPAVAAAARRGLGRVPLELRRGGGRGVGEAGPDRDRPAGDPRLPLRLPRPDRPDDGADDGEGRLPRPLRAAARAASTTRPIRTATAAPAAPTPPDANCICDWEAQLDLTFHQFVYPEHVAAIIVEPVLGEGGYLVPPPGFLPRLREITRQHGILLIADEVQTGLRADRRAVRGPALGRRARHHRHGQGHRVRAAAVRDSSPSASLLDKLPPGSHGGTYGGNVVACAAANATLDVIEDEGLVANARERGAQFLAGLRALAPKYRSIGDVRGLGLMLALEFVEARRGRRPRPEPRRHEAGPGRGARPEADRPDGRHLRERRPDHPAARHDGRRGRPRPADDRREPRRRRRMTTRRPASRACRAIRERRWSSSPQTSNGSDIDRAAHVRGASGRSGTSDHRAGARRVAQRERLGRDAVDAVRADARSTTSTAGSPTRSSGPTWAGRRAGSAQARSTIGSKIAVSLGEAVIAVALWDVLDEGDRAELLGAWARRWRLGDDRGRPGDRRPLARRRHAPRRQRRPRLLVPGAARPRGRLRQGASPARGARRFATQLDEDRRRGCWPTSTARSPAGAASGRGRACRGSSIRGRSRRSTIGRSGRSCASTSASATGAGASRRRSSPASSTTPADRARPGVEAYPIDPEGGRVDAGFGYVGVTPMFEKAGFRRVVETAAHSDRRPRILMRLMFRRR